MARAVAVLSAIARPSRIRRLQEILASRVSDTRVVLENVADGHNAAGSGAAALLHALFGKRSSTPRYRVHCMLFSLLIQPVCVQSRRSACSMSTSWRATSNLISRCRASPPPMQMRMSPETASVPVCHRAQGLVRRHRPRLQVADGAPPRECEGLHGIAGGRRLPGAPTAGSHMVRPG